MKKAYSKILVITDNLFIYNKFRKIIKQVGLNTTSFTYRFSIGNEGFLDKFSGNSDFTCIDVKKDLDMIIKSFDLVISLHSKQIFPVKMVNGVKCINIHPGYNPYNRGWSPQTFSILNGMPVGATIHEIDEQIDHGRIIDQVEVPLYHWDTSLSAYNRILKAEVILIKKNIIKIIRNDYKSEIPTKGGNINLKKDFKTLCEINLNERAQFGEFINRLRATSHSDYKNAFFIDNESGRKVYISINLKVEE